MAVFVPLWGCTQRVQATKELVEIFEQKIKDKIAEVWGGV